MRLYDESKCGGEHVLPVEIYYLFQNAFKNSYKVFFLNCKPNHSIIIPKSDLEFLKTSIKSDDEKIYLQYIFSDNTLNIKDLQYNDILQICNLAVKNNNVGAYFIYPELVDNYYCFHLFLIVKDDFNLEQFLNLKFNIIKINSVIEYNKDTLTIPLMIKMFNLLDLQFKDYIIPHDDMKKTRPYNVLDLQEKKDLEDYYEYYFDFQKKNPNADITNLKNNIRELQKKL